MKRVFNQAVKEIEESMQHDRIKRRFSEGTILFFRVVKWVFLASIIGLVVGFASFLFLKALEWAIGTGRMWEYTYMLIPVAFIVGYFIIKWFAPDAQGHGTEKVIEAVHKKSGKIDFLVAPIKLITTVLTIGTGGSAGKEGPATQIGGGLASKTSDLLRLNDADRKKLVICGIGAGFASVFGTPIAGAIFGLEVLFVGAIMYEVLLPAFVSGIIAFHTTKALGIQYTNHYISLAGINQWFILWVILAGVVFGIIAIMFIEMMERTKRVADTLNDQPLIKPLIGGAALILLVWLFKTKQALGLGDETITIALAGGIIVWYAFFLKMLFTSITLNFGGSGGLITPTFFIGAAAGSTIAHVLGFNPAIFAALGIIGVLSAATNTPIASSILSLEMFGPEIAPYGCMVAVIAFLMSGNRSIYHTQVFTISKSVSEEDYESYNEVKKRVNKVTGSAVRMTEKTMRTTYDNVGRPAIKMGKDTIEKVKDSGKMARKRKKEEIKKL